MQGNRLEKEHHRQWWQMWVNNSLSYAYIQYICECVWFESVKFFKSLKSHSQPHEVYDQGCLPYSGCSGVWCSRDALDLVFIRGTGLIGIGASRKELGSCPSHNISSHPTRRRHLHNWKMDCFLLCRLLSTFSLEHFNSIVIKCYPPFDYLPYTRNQL